MSPGLKEINSITQVVYALIDCEYSEMRNAVNTLRPRQVGRHFPDDILKWIFLNEDLWILIEISLKFVSRGPINNIPALVQIMAWRRPGDKPLSEPMMVNLLTHICITRPQWVKGILISMINSVLLVNMIRHRTKKSLIYCKTILNTLIMIEWVLVIEMSEWWIKNYCTYISICSLSLKITSF